MATQLAVRENGANATLVQAAVLEKTLIVGDLSQLTPSERVSFYLTTCESLRLNPLTKPFEYLELGDRGQAKLVLYANKNCADQLRGRDHVDLKIVGRELVEDLYIVTARATLPDGRSDESIGAVPLSKEDGDWAESSSGKRYFKGKGTFSPLHGDARANAVMKAETKAKRRATLSICGLGYIDESEVDSIAGARRVEVDYTTGEILDAPPPQPAPRQAARAEAPPADEPRAIDRVKGEADYRALCDQADSLGEPCESYDRTWADLLFVQKFRELRTRVRLREKALAERAEADKVAAAAP